jgi:hypothetical protein
MNIRLRLIFAAALLAQASCVAAVDSDVARNDDVEAVGVAADELIVPASCTGGSISYGQSKSSAAPALNYCFTQPVYNGNGKKYYYKIEFGPASGGNWITMAQQLATWTSGKFAIRIWTNNQMIVQTLKGSGSVASPISATFYGLSGQKYYIQVGLLFPNGEFNSLGAVPWSMLTRMTSLGLL